MGAGSSSWEGQTVWVVGASSGIGRALAVEFVRRGANVVVSARRAEALEALASELNGGTGDKRAVALPFDATDLSLAGDMARRAAEAFGPGGDDAVVDAVVLCQGVSNRGTVAETDLSVEKRLFEVNFFSPVALVKAVLPGFLRRGAGRVVVVSSVQGLFALPERAPYSASKHAITGYFDALRAEVAHKGVQVNVLEPGYVRTELSLRALTTDAGAAHGQMDATTASGYAPEDFARRAVDAVARGKEHAVIAQASAVLAVWLKRWCPSLLSWVMKRRGAKLALQREL